MLTHTHTHTHTQRSELGYDNNSDYKLVVSAIIRCVAKLEIYYPHVEKRQSGRYNVVNNLLRILSGEK